MTNTTHCWKGRSPSLTANPHQRSLLCLVSTPPKMNSPPAALYSQKSIFSFSTMVTRLISITSINRTISRKELKEKKMGTNMTLIPKNRT